MAHLFRLTLALLALVIGSYAQAAISPSYEYRVAQHTYGDWSSSMEAACAAWGAETVAKNEGFTLIYTKVVEGACEVRGNFRYSQPASSTSTISSRSGACPANSTASGNSCVCNSGFNEFNGACPAVVDPNNASSFCKNAGSYGQSWRQTGRSTGSTPSTACYMPYPPFTDPTQGCVTSINDSVAVPNADGTRSWSATGIATGATCTQGGTSEGGTGVGGPGGTGNGANPPQSAPNPCPNGFPGTVNGMAVCAQPVPDNGVDSTVKSSTTNADGTKSDVVEETKCNGGTCVTNTTVNNYNSSGGAIGTSTTSSTQPITSLCAKNPGNKVCSATGLAPTGNTGTGTGSTGNTGTGSGGTGNGTGSGGTGTGSSGGESGDGKSSFNGTCAAGFKAVSDDAVTNAMAEEQHRRNCEMLRKDTDEAKAVDAVSDKDGKTKAENPNDFEVKVGPSNFDQTDALGGGGCSLDKTITVAKMQVTLPFNAICNPLAALGQLLVAVSLLGAMVIMTRG